MNPWLSIEAEDYENHMSDSNVYQLQTLNSIMLSQISDYKPNSLAIFGIATGNGLEYTEMMDIVYAIDINDKYLTTCKNRFANRNNIKYLNLDIDNSVLPFTNVDMAICNLVLEYIDYVGFIKKISSILNKNGILSIVYQNELKYGFVSKTKYSEVFECLNSIYHNIDKKTVIETSKTSGLTVSKSLEYKLLNGKTFTRIDLRKNNN